jgi:monoamine oxidase
MFTDVVVIGAGMAGLSAARELSRRRHRVVVLEATERLGGRVRTRHQGWPTPIELGAEFVHGEAQEVRQLAHEAGADLIDVTMTHWQRQDGALRPAEASFETSLAALSEAPPDDLPIDDHIAAQVASGRLPRAAASFARRYAAGFYAARLARASTRAIATLEAEADARLQRVRQGYGALVDKLERDAVASGSMIWRGCFVRAVEWSSSQVLVHTNGNGLVVRARAAVVTPSIGVLRAADDACLHFVPRLPDWKQRAIDAFEMGPVARAVLRLHEPLRFSDDYDGGLLHADGEAMPTVWPAHPDQRTYVAWAGGDQVDQLGAVTIARLREVSIAALAQLSGLPTERIVSLISALETHDWIADPYCRGAYAYVLAGRADDARRLGDPIAGTVYFAGEATSVDQAGTVQGAIASGTRAAHQITAHLHAPEESPDALL